MDRLMSAIEEIHLIELELLDAEPMCELSHDGAPAACTHEVVARRVIGCEKSYYLMCAAGTKYTHGWIANNDRHATCRQRLADCWKVLPI